MDVFFYINTGLKPVFFDKKLATWQFEVKCNECIQCGEIGYNEA